MRNGYEGRYINELMPQGPFNLYSYFIGPNPVTTFNTISEYPRIHSSSFVGPFTSIIGNVSIGLNVFIAPNVSIRADEGTPFYIGNDTNIQDGVVLHGLKNGRVRVNSNYYSIYIDKEVSCAHGCIVHGPCYIGRSVFIGFKAIVFNAIVDEEVYISSGAVVTNGVHITAGRFVPPGAEIDTQEKADSLALVPKDKAEFVREVQRVNNEFPASYSLMFGEKKCSCGLCCD